MFGNLFKADCFFFQYVLYKADILKEDMGQNTCIFSTEFSLRMMGDIQQFYIDNKVRSRFLTDLGVGIYHAISRTTDKVLDIALWELSSSSTSIIRC